MDKSFILKFGNRFFNEYVVVEKEMTQEVVIEELTKIADIAIKIEEATKGIRLENNEANTDVIVEIYNISSQDEAVSFNNYLICFKEKYTDMLFKLTTNNRELYCF